MRPLNFCLSTRHSPCLYLPASHFTPHRSHFHTHPSLSSPLRLFLRSKHFWRRCSSMSPHTQTHTLLFLFLFYVMRRAGERRMWKILFILFFSRGMVGGDGEVCEWRLTQSPPCRLLPPPLPGGLYGWKWGILSETSLTQTVPAALPKNQPEGREADDHRHRGSVPRRKAAHSPGLPHGELHPHAAVSCLPLLWRTAVRSGGDSVMFWCSVVLLQCVELLLNLSWIFPLKCSGKIVHWYINFCFWFFSCFPWFCWSLVGGSIGGSPSLSLLFQSLVGVLT